MTAYFADGTSESGAVLVGVDGAKSLSRRYLGPEMSMLSAKLPFCNVGVTTRVSGEKIRNLREQVDPLMFRATHPESGVSMWWASSFDLILSLLLFIFSLPSPSTLPS